MIKKTIITVMVLIILNTIITFNSGINSIADECNDCTPIPSTPGDTDYCSINQNNPESKPIIQASSDEIGPGSSISLHIKTDSLSHPPYNWSVSSTKYTLDKITTMSNNETVTMTAASGTCSSTGYNNSNIYMTITVKDKCGVNSQTIIRNTFGTWKSKGGRSESINDCNATTYSKYYYVDNLRVRITLGKGTTDKNPLVNSHCNMPGELIDKWQANIATDMVTYGMSDDATYESFLASSLLDVISSSGFGSWNTCAYYNACLKFWGSCSGTCYHGCGAAQFDRWECP